MKFKVAHYPMFPEQLELRDYMLGLDDVLRCWHLMRARSKLSTVFVSTVQATTPGPRS